MVENDSKHAKNLQKLHILMADLILLTRKTISRGFSIFAKKLRMIFRGSSSISQSQSTFRKKYITDTEYPEEGLKLKIC